jgi:hypothetical protein
VGPLLGDEDGVGWPVGQMYFDHTAWDWGADRACAKCRYGPIPDCLILWELVKWQYLPVHYPVWVMLVRLMHRFRLLPSVRRYSSPRYPTILTIGRYGINPDLDDLPF